MKRRRPESQSVSVPGQQFTASDLWHAYRRQCCDGESGEALHWQQLAFLSGASAALGAVFDGTDSRKLLQSVDDAFDEAITGRIHGIIEGN